jgi:hypothetical protein
MREDATRRRKVHVGMVVLFGWATMGADGSCGVESWNAWNAPPPPKASTLFCYTDPPQGCYEYCAGLDNPQYTDACNNVEAGPRTMAFQNAADAVYQNALNQGIHVCNGSNSGDPADGSTDTVKATPCQFGYPPVLWPGQDTEVCSVPAPGCSS